MLDQVVKNLTLYTSSFGTSDFLVVFIIILVLELLEITEKPLKRVSYANKLFLGFFQEIRLIKLLIMTIDTSYYNLLLIFYIL